MNKRKNIAFRIFRWIIVAGVFIYLFFTLSQVEVWDDLSHHFQNANRNRLLSLLIVLILMPFNIGLEAKKWQIIVKAIENISFVRALKSILSGIATGFVSPNRIGDFAGRILFLSEGNKAKGVILSLVNSFVQNFILILFGVTTASLFYLHYKNEAIAFNYLIKIALIVIAVIALLVVLFFITKNSFSNKYSEKIREFIQIIYNYSFAQILAIVLFTTLRYLVYCIQFYYTLAFFGIDLSFWEGVLAIPTTYLIVTFAPSYAIAEPAIRGTVSLLILSSFTSNEVGVVLTSVVLWLINYIFPLLLGSVILAKQKSISK